MEFLVHHYHYTLRSHPGVESLLAFPNIGIGVLHWGLQHQRGVLCSAELNPILRHHTTLSRVPNCHFNMPCT